MPIKALVFDCGGVLLRDRDASAYDRWEHKLNLERGELKLRLWESANWARAEIGELSESEFWAQAGRELGLDSAEASRLARDLWHSWAVDPVVLSLIDKARSRFRVAMLSNATDALEAILETRYGIGDRFESIVNSARVGIAKPAEGIYRHLLAALGVQANEVVFIDDRAENIAAAAQLGIHVIWYVNADELERQLAAYLRVNGTEADATTAAESHRQEMPDPTPSVAQVR